MRKFIFDVDGTLTPSRGKIHDDFFPYMMHFSCKYDVYLVTGSDRQKTIDQIGEELYNNCKMRGHKLMYLIDGAGNFIRKVAANSLYDNSDYCISSGENQVHSLAEYCQSYG